jgi:hypothetical protein
MIVGVGEAVGKMKRKMTCNHSQSFFYMHSVSMCDEQNILNLEMALFHLKCTVSTIQLSITDFFRKSDLHAGINITFHLFITFVCLAENL